MDQLEPDGQSTNSSCIVQNDEKSKWKHVLKKYWEQFVLKVLPLIVLASIVGLIVGVVIVRGKNGGTTLPESDNPSHSRQDGTSIFTNIQHTHKAPVCRVNGETDPCYEPYCKTCSTGVYPELPPKIDSKCQDSEHNTSFSMKGGIDCYIINGCPNPGPNCLTFEEIENLKCHSGILTKGKKSCLNCINNTCVDHGQGQMALTACNLLLEKKCCILKAFAAKKDRCNGGDYDCDSKNVPGHCVCRSDKKGKNCTENAMRNVAITCKCHEDRELTTPLEECGKVIYYKDTNNKACQMKYEIGNVKYQCYCNNTEEASPNSTACVQIFSNTDSQSAKKLISSILFEEDVNNASSSSQESCNAEEEKYKI